MRPTDASINSAVTTRLAKKGLLYPLSSMFVPSGGVQVAVTYGVTSIFLAMFAFIGYNQSLRSCDQVASIRACASCYK